MQNVYIVEAVRSPLGKRGGGLATVHPADLLGVVQKAVLDRAKLDPSAVDQVVSGCVSQVGEPAAALLHAFESLVHSPAVLPCVTEVAKSPQRRLARVVRRNTSGA